jgi:small subunit ribosomal protein S18
MEKQSFSQKVRVVDYKDTDFLRRFINPNGRILPRRVTGASSRNQRKVANAIKRARFMGLLPFIER